MGAELPTEWHLESSSGKGDAEKDASGWESQIYLLNHHSLELKWTENTAKETPADEQAFQAEALNWDNWWGESGMEEKPQWRF